MNDPNRRKIFTIGFHKTGTSSIHLLLARARIKSIHTTIPVMKIIDQYDAFSDGIHKEFAQYYKKYPNSVFILNTRPIDKWIISKYKHAKTHGFKPCNLWPVEDHRTNYWIKEREKHYQNIFDFFKDKPDQLFIVNIEKNGWEKELLQYLKLPPPVKEFHINKRPDSHIPPNIMETITTNVSRCLSDAHYDANDVLFKDADISKYNFKMFI